MAHYTKFWLMRKHQIKILYIFVTYPREIYLFVKKDSFLSKSKAHLASWQPKKLGIKTAFFGENLGVKELKHGLKVIHSPNFFKFGVVLKFFLNIIFMILDPIVFFIIITTAVSTIVIYYFEV